MAFLKNKKVLLFVGIFVLLFIIYKWFFSGSEPTPDPYALMNPTAGGLVSELSASPADAIVGRELLTILLELKSISLDTTLFTPPVFTSLKDWSKPIDPQPLGKSLGRRNPFSDFGKTAATTSSQGSAPAVPLSAFGPSH